MVWPSNFSRSLGFRQRRLLRFLELVETVYIERGAVSIVDLGGTREYWNMVEPSYLRARRVRITLVNPYEPNEPVEDDIYTLVRASALHLPQFEAMSFDIVHSNAVLEHVGGWDKMVRFSDEVKRLAPNHYVQTPNYWFPLEPHSFAPFIHWLPRPTQVFLVRHFALGHWAKAKTIDEAIRTTEDAYMLTREMFRTLFPDSDILTERILLIPKCFVAVRGLRTSTSRTY